MSELAQLICGVPTGTGKLAKTLIHLSSVIEDVQVRLPRPNGREPHCDALTVPFLSRVLLEVSCTALLARIDPFRVLTIRTAQAQGDYKPGERLASAIQWQGDVLCPTEKNLKWNRGIKDIPRALVGDYMGDLVWKPAFLKCVDEMQGFAEPLNGPRSRRLRSFDERSFIPWIRSEIRKAYSTASKGVHYEFLSASTTYDTTTLAKLVDDVITICSTLGCVLNFCDHIPFRPNPTVTLTNFGVLDNDEVN